PLPRFDGDRRRLLSDAERGEYELLRTRVRVGGRDRIVLRLAAALFAGDLPDVDARDGTGIRFQFRANHRGDRRAPDRKLDARTRRARSGVRVVQSDLSRGNGTDLADAGDERAAASGVKT